MTKPCKICGLPIVIGGRYPDQVAQEQGYCGEGCQSVDEKSRELEEKFLDQEGR